MDDVSRHVDYSFPSHDIELARNYGPDVVLWQLTGSGTKRIEDRTLPPLLPMRSYQILELLHRLGYAEEDEISNHLDMSLTSVRNTLKRLIGFGYVQRVQQSGKE